MKFLRPSIPLLGVVCLGFWVSAFASTPAPASPQTADSWIFPLGNDGYLYFIRQNTKYGTRVENTDYTARNLDLILGGADRITCFELGGHRLYHAGVDLYRVGSPATGAQVKAIANGVVTHVGTDFPGSVIVLRHDLPSGPPVYSLYGHLDVTNTISVDDPINKGYVLGTVRSLPHDGHFPEFHPDGNDSHLHFEIRTFADATTVGLPAACDVAGKAGVGYTYPNFPDSYGYLDPMAFLRVRVPANRVYLPMMRNGKITANCQSGQNLVQNTGFESGTLSDPPPWVEISTLLSWVAPLVGTSPAYQGRSALLGGWSEGVVVDEELPQSFIMPASTLSATWTMILGIVPDDEFSPDLDDYFNLTLNDAQTGVNLLSGEGIWIDGNDFPANTWIALSIQITGLNTLAGKNVSLSYIGWSDQIRPTLMVVDNVGFTTSCSSANSPQIATPVDEGLAWSITSQPISGPPLVLIER
jgi:murein DD-endopeptidase MepM/ murein hydrolase activator NlpD